VANKNQELDERAFDKLVNAGSFFLKKGYARAWFTWLEWVGLASILLVAGRKTDSVLMMVIGFLSIGLVFFVSLAAVESEIQKLIKASKLTKRWVFLVVAIGPLATVLVVIKVISVLISMTEV
jgi:hypothetical protein